MNNSALSAPMLQKLPDRYHLTLLLAVSFILRLGLSIAFPNLWHADEIFQTLEPAHHLAFGYGFLSWEWEDGIRSWIFPGFLAAIMKTCSLFSDNPNAYLYTIDAIMIAFSLIPIAVTYRITELTSNRRLALIAACVPAFWYELIFLSAKTLSGSLPAYLLIYAAYCVWKENNQPTNQAWPWLQSGLLFGLTAILRIHLLPEMVFVAVACCRRNGLAWRMLIFGFLITFTAGGLLDWATWDYPFQSIIKNILINLFNNKANQYGTEPFYHYGLALIYHQLIYFFPFVYFGYLGCKKNTLLAGIAILNLLSFSLLAHKEYRFILLTIITSTMLVGLGLAHFMQAPHRHLKRWYSIIILSIMLWITGAIYYFHLNYKKSALRLTLQLHQMIASQPSHPNKIIFDEYDIIHLGGYSYLHENIPMQFNRKKHGLMQPSPDNKNSLIVLNHQRDQPHLNKLLCTDLVCIYQD